MRPALHAIAHAVRKLVTGVADTTAVFFGDSVTAYTGASDSAHGWTSLLCAAQGLTQLNKGISGTILQNSSYAATTGAAQVGNGRDRFAADLQGPNARQRYYLAYGYNDCRYTGGTGSAGVGTAVSLANYVNDYREVLNGLISNGVSPSKIYIISPYWMSDAGLTTGSTGYTTATRANFVAYVAAAAALATEYGTNYTDVYAYVAANGNTAWVAADNIHPNDAGHAGIATAVATLTVQGNSKNAPTSVSAAKSAAGAMTVTWAAPAASGFTITDYTVEYGRKSDTTAATAFVMTGTTNTSSLTQTFTGLADYWYVARVRANYSDSTSSAWAWFTTGAAVDSRTTDTTIISTDFRTATVGVNLESISPWVKKTPSTSSNVIAGGGAGTRGYNTPEVINGTTANQTYVYSAGSIALPGSGSLFGEFLVSYMSSAGGNANTSIMLQGNSGTTANGIMVLYNDTSFRIFKDTANSIATATGTTTGTVSLQPGLEYLWRLEVSSGVQKAYLNNALICSATEPLGGAWGTEVGFRLANTSTLATDSAGTHIKTARYGTTV